MRAGAIEALFAVFVVASLGAGYLVGTNNRSTSTFTSVSTSTLTSIPTSAHTSSQTVFATVTTTVNTVTSTTVNTVTSTIFATPIPVSSVETADVSVGGSPNTIAVNPNTNRIYAAGGSNSLVVIDAVSYAVVARVTLPANSNSGIAIDFNSNTVYVLVQGGVAVINGTTNTVVREFSVSFGYRSIAYDSTTHTLYGSPQGMGTGYLVGVDGRTGAVVANISLGYWASDVVVNPSINMIYAVGCKQFGLACGSEVSVVNGTSETVVNRVNLGSAYYATATIDQRTGSVYVTGGSSLVELNRLGTIVYNSYPETCGPFIGMSVDSSLDQVLLAPQDYPYLLAYNRVFGNLVNMYSLPDVPQFVAYNSATSETYVAVSESLLAFHGIATTGHVNGTLIGSDQNCLPV